MFWAKINPSKVCILTYLVFVAEEAMVGEPIEAPPCPYKIQPENQGKLLWITGAAGMGKSTSAQLLARNKGMYFPSNKNV